MSPIIFPKLVKKILKPLPRNDYPSLNTFTFVSCCLEYVMNKSIVSKRDLFKRLNNHGFSLNISTFSKASKTSNCQVFEDLIKTLKIQLKQKKGKDKSRALFPIYSTIVTLTSKFFWQDDIHKVKLFCSLDTITSEVGGIFIHFGQGHDHKHGEKTVNSIPKNSIGVMDRGFASSLQISNLKYQKNQSFVLKIKNNVTL